SVEAKRLSVGRGRHVAVGRMDQRRLQSRLEGGRVLALDDGSLWEVAPVDRFKTALWLPREELLVVRSNNPFHPYRLVGERESVEAKRLPVGRGW
ncbi:MAG TPA: hypothetical protein VLH79_06935, partial [Chthonomonadales bacterium]|nr:hypothetical protein [Chthonomonadales bacterium]